MVQELARLCRLMLSFFLLRLGFTRWVVVLILLVLIFECALACSLASFQVFSQEISGVLADA